MNSTWQEDAQELTVRFLRAGERAIDFSFTDGNFFFPDYSEIKSKLHLVKHFGNKVESRIMAATMMLALAAHFSDKLTFVSELSVKELELLLSSSKQFTQILTYHWLYKKTTTAAVV